MNILLAANEDYYLPTKVMLTSLLENNIFENHNIYFLYNSMSEHSVNCLKKYIESNYRVSFIKNKIDIEDFKDFPLSHHFSIETYFRFLVQDIIPKSEDRVLWLDADMIIKGDLKEFYYQDFDTKALVVCKSINKNPEELLNRLQCPSGTIYFNAGTILFNLKEVRKLRLQDYKNYFEKNKEKITWLDQDILNAVYALNTKIVDYKKYNMQFFHDNKFSKKELQHIKRETIILHYIGAVKPWHYDYMNVCGKYWHTYAKKVYSASDRMYFMYRRCRYILMKKIRH